jgi:hypothetical protein
LRYVALGFYKFEKFEISETVCLPFHGCDFMVESFKSSRGNFASNTIDELVGVIASSVRKTL